MFKVCQVGEICSPDGLSRCWRGWRGYQETDTGTLSLNLHSTLLNINRNFACLAAEEVFEGQEVGPVRGMMAVVMKAR